MEEWKLIPGYGENYKMHQSGAIYSLLSNRYLKTGDNGKGYKFVNLWTPNGEHKREYVHRLCLKVFSGHKEGLECNHIDGNKSNNHIDNLEWVTKSQNHKHAYETGLNRVSEYQKKRTSDANRGSGHGGTRLKERDIINIRHLYDSGMTYKKISNIYGVHRDTIGNIVRGNTWKHV